MRQPEADHSPTSTAPGPADTERGVSRRAVVGGAAWAAPALVITAAAPTFASSATLTLTALAPSTSAFSEDKAASRTITANLRRDGDPVNAAAVTFTLSDSTWLEVASASVLTTSDGNASTVLNAVDGATPALGAETVLTAAHGSATTTWTVTYRPFTALAGGSSAMHALAVADGRLHGWGSNGYGAVGDGTTVDRQVPRPAGTTSMTSPIARTTRGEYHSLAIDTSGRLFVWGANGGGQVGDNSTTHRHSPVQILPEPAPITVTHIAAGNNHSVAVTSSGRIYACGENSLKQLGLPAAGSPVQVPTEVGRGDIPSGITVTALAAGANHNLVLGSDGWVYAWGRGIAGQTGNGQRDMSVDAPTPISRGEVPSTATIVAVCAGASHSLALASNGHLYGWGENGVGQLGNGTFTSTLVPKRVLAGELPVDEQIVAVAAGNQHTVALATDGRLYSWGLNNHGQLGDGTHNIRNQPVRVSLGAMPSTSRVVDFATGTMNTYAITDSGLTYAWGQQAGGQLGNGATDSSFFTTPVKVTVVP